MIKHFVKAFDAKRKFLLKSFEESPPEDYKELVGRTIKAIEEQLNDQGERGYNTPDSERIYEVDDGDYQGTLIYIIGASGYQPENYWSVKVSYGSCSGCDTLEDIHSDGDDEDPEDKRSRAKQYLTLALHIVQGLRPLSGRVI